MKYFVFILLCSFFSCEQKDKNELIKNDIRAYFLYNIPDLKSVDTILVLPETLSLKTLHLLQAAECSRAAAEAGIKGKREDSSRLQRQSYRFFDSLDYRDSVRFQVLRAVVMVMYTDQQLNKRSVKEWLYYDEKYNRVSLYHYIQKMSSRLETMTFSGYTPLTKERCEDYQRRGIWIYK